MWRWNRIAVFAPVLLHFHVVALELRNLRVESVVAFSISWFQTCECRTHGQPRLIGGTVGNLKLWMQFRGNLKQLGGHVADEDQWNEAGFWRVFHVLPTFCKTLDLMSGFRSWDGCMLRILETMGKSDLLQTSPNKILYYRRTKSFRWFLGNSSFAYHIFKFPRRRDVGYNERWPHQWKCFNNLTVKRLVAKQECGQFFWGECNQRHPGWCCQPHQDWRWHRGPRSCWGQNFIACHAQMQSPNGRSIIDCLFYWSGRHWIYSQTSRWWFQWRRMPSKNSELQKCFGAMSLGLVSFA